MTTQNEVMEALSQVKDPELGRNLVELNMVRNLQIEDGKVTFTLALTVPSCPLRDKMGSDARQAVMNLPGVKDVVIEFSAMTEEERRAVLGKGAPGLPKLNKANQVKRVIAVMSGKGGVGKSSVTALLGVTMNRIGQKVGILDADITGPSIPKLFGLASGGLRGSEAGILPAITKQGIKVMSANLLLQDEDAPIIWRGPMISGAITQFWNDTLWGKLDVLLVDLPPGTSDAALSVMQNLPLSGIILVTTPQDLAAMVVRKAIHMANQLNIPILGVVENMSYFPCPETGVQHAVFGPSHIEEITRMVNVPISTRLPINSQVSTLSDEGRVEEIVIPEINLLVESLLEPA
jgi:Mrp family chromosome partitioning ATPase